MKNVITTHFLVNKSVRYYKLVTSENGNGSNLGSISFELNPVNE